MHGRDGQTLGKKVMKTRLVTVNGAKPDQATIIKRTAIFPGIYAIAGLLGFISIFGSLLIWLLVGAFLLVDGIFVLQTRCGGRRCTTSGRARSWSRPSRKSVHSGGVGFPTPDPPSRW